MSIKFKTLLFISLILILPITILGLFSYIEAKNGLEYLAQNQMQILAQNQVTTIRSKLEFIIRSNPDILNTEDVLASLIEDDLYKIKLSQHSYIFIINKEGRILLHPRREKKFLRENFLESKYQSVVNVAKRMITENEGFDNFVNEDGFMYLYFVKYNQGEVISGSSKIEPKYTLDWTIAVVMSQKDVLIAARKIQIIFFIVSLISLIVTIILGYTLINFVLIKNINKLVIATRRISENDESFHLNIKSKDEIGYLGKSFNEMVIELKTARDKLVRQEILKQELELAAKIQTYLLPKRMESKNYDISAKMLPSDQVGGDYYDFLNITDQRIWLGIGDVSGHGLKSGLIMMMAQTAFNTILLSNPNISSYDLIVQVNRVLYHNVHDRMGEDNFMTLSFLSADNYGNVIHAGAHLDIMIYRNRTEKIEKIKTSGVWLGIIPELGDKVFQNQFFLEKNDVMILYTDGIIEAMDSKRNLYEPERLEDLFQKVGKLSSNEIRDVILNDVLEYLDIQLDDISIVVVKKK